MRLKYSKLLTFIVFVINAILLYYTWKLFLSDRTGETAGYDEKAVTEKIVRQKDRIQSTNRHIKKAITIVFRDFYHFENDLQHSIDSILNLIPSVQIVVVYDSEPYPPMAFIANYTTIYSNVKFINLSFDVKKTARALSPVFQMKTKYALFMPDSVRLGGRTIVQKMLKEIEKVDKGDAERTKQILSEGNEGGAGSVASSSSSKSICRKVVVIPFASNVKTMGNCCRIKMDLANWTMEYSVKNGTDNCDMVIFVEYFSIFSQPIQVRSPSSSFKSTQFSRMLHSYAQCPAHWPRRFPKCFTCKPKWANQRYKPQTHISGFAKTPSLSFSLSFHSKYCSTGCCKMANVCSPLTTINSAKRRCANNSSKKCTKN